jgi:hypothetical protein
MHDVTDVAQEQGALSVDGTCEGAGVPAQAQKPTSLEGAEASLVPSVIDAVLALAVGEIDAVVDLSGEVQSGMAQGLGAVEDLQLFALSWRSATTGTLMEMINFAARDEADLLERFNKKVPRERRVGPSGPTLGGAGRRVEHDPDDSLQWLWQPHGLSLQDASRSLSQLCVPVTKKG